MREIRRYFGAAVAVAAGAPGLGAALRGQWAVTTLALVGGALWLTPWLGAGLNTWLSEGPRKQLAALGAVLCLGSLLVAVWLDVEMGWLLVGMAAFLAAWDLQAFHAQLTGVSYVENESRLVCVHVQRLALVTIAGLAVGTLGLFLRVSLNFVVALGVAFLAVLGLIYSVYHLSQQEKEESPRVTPKS
jgi:hypothetical protein